MKKRLYSVVITSLFVLFLGGAVVAQWIGGVSIRLTDTKVAAVKLSGALLRGVPTIAGLGDITVEGDQTGEVVWQTEAGDDSLAIITLPVAGVPIVFSCTGPAMGRLVVWRLPDKQVLAMTRAQLLPPGPDCF